MVWHDLAWFSMFDALYSVQAHRANRWKVSASRTVVNRLRFPTVPSSQSTLQSETLRVGSVAPAHTNLSSLRKNTGLDDVWTAAPVSTLKSWC